MSKSIDDKGVDLLKGVLMGGAVLSIVGAIALGYVLISKNVKENALIQTNNYQQVDSETKELKQRLEKVEKIIESMGIERSTKEINTQDVKDGFISMPDGLEKEIENPNNTFKEQKDSELKPLVQESSQKQQVDSEIKEYHMGTK